MPPKTRSAARVDAASTVEQPVRRRTPRMNTSHVNKNVGVVGKEEVLINQIFGKMIEILQTVIKRRGPQGENETLECFLRFQPPIFVGEAEQDHKAEAWLESLEDIFKTLNYSEERMIKFATFRLRGPTKDWWTRVQDACEQSGMAWNWCTFALVFRDEYIP
jgi:hypothetical protein